MSIIACFYFQYAHDKSKPVLIEKKTGEKIGAWSATRDSETYLSKGDIAWLNDVYKKDTCVDGRCKKFLIF